MKGVTFQDGEPRTKPTQAKRATRKLRGPNMSSSVVKPTHRGKGNVPVLYRVTHILTRLRS